MRVGFIAAASLLIASGACAGGATPPPFRGPVVSSVSVGPMPRPVADDNAEPDSNPPLTSRGTSRSTSPKSTTTPTTTTAMINQPVAVPISRAPYRGPNLSVRTVVAQSPSSAVTGTSVALVGKLRALVGVRDKRASHVSFVIDTLRKLGANMPKATDGDDLYKTAKTRRALITTQRPRLGDIIVFDKFLRKKPNSMTAIVVTIDQRNTVEFIYLARKIVRRGFLNLGQRKSKRDARGKIMNTILRHLQSGDRRSTPYLSGQLFSSYISLKQLTR